MKGCLQLKWHSWGGTVSLVTVCCLRVLYCVSGRVQIQTSARWELCIIWTLPKTVFVERLTRLAYFKGIQKYGLRDLEFLTFSEIHY